MRISISVARHARPGDPAGPAVPLERVVRTAGDLGLDTVWVADHLLTADPGEPAGSPDAAVLEVYTTLSLLVSRSERVGLGVMAGAVTHRAPGLVIEAVTTLGALSGGRVRLGAGAGHGEREPAATDRPAPALPGRFEGVEDLLRLAHRIWAGDGSAYPGSPTGLAGAYVGLPPFGVPHPPVLISGHGEVRMLPLVARYADACNLLDVAPGGAILLRKLGILGVHCRKIGRPLSDVDVSVTAWLRPEERVDELVARCRHFAGLGIGHVVLAPVGHWTPGALSTLAGAAPAILGTGTGTGTGTGARPGEGAGVGAGTPRQSSADAPETAYLDGCGMPAVGAPV